MAKDEFSQPDQAAGHPGPARPVQPARIQPPSCAEDRAEAEKSIGPEESLQERALEDYLARIAKDQEMVQELQWGGYKGRRWDEFVATLVEYGYPVIRSWIQSGLIYQRCRAQRLRGLPATPPMLEAHDVDELARDTVTEAVLSFRDKVLKKHLWRATGGASLKTFFVGRGLIEFVTLFKKWIGTRRMIPSDNADLFENPVPFPYSDPEQTALVRLELQRVRATVDDPIAIEAFILREEGYRHKEIADRLGLPSAKAVESLIYRTKEAQGHESA